MIGKCIPPLLWTACLPVVVGVLGCLPSLVVANDGPPAVTELVATALPAGNAVELTWTNPTPAPTSVIVRRGSDGRCPASPAEDVVDVPLAASERAVDEDPTLVDGVEVCYSVFALYDGGATSAPASARVTPADREAPQTPTLALRLVRNDRAVELLTADVAADGLRLHLRRNEGDAPPTSLDEGVRVPTTRSSLDENGDGVADEETVITVDPDVTDGARYSYAAFVEDDAGNVSAPASARIEIRDVTPPSPSLSFFATSSAPDRVELHWLPNTTFATPFGDLDGDWLPDARDLCIRRDGEPAGGQQDGANDRFDTDGDGVGDPCDPDQGGTPLVDADGFPIDARGQVEVAQMIVTRAPGAPPAPGAGEVVPGTAQFVDGRFVLVDDNRLPGSTWGYRLTLVDDVNLANDERTTVITTLVDSPATIGDATLVGSYGLSTLVPTAAARLPDGATVVTGIYAFNPSSFPQSVNVEFLGVDLWFPGSCPNPDPCAEPFLLVLEPDGTPRFGQTYAFPALYGLASLTLTQTDADGIGLAMSMGRTTRASLTVHTGVGLGPITLAGTAVASEQPAAVAWRVDPATGTITDVVAAILEIARDAGNSGNERIVVQSHRHVDAEVVSVTASGTFGGAMPVRLERVRPGTPTGDVVSLGGPAVLSAGQSLWLSADDDDAVRWSRVIESPPPVPGRIPFPSAAVVVDGVAIAAVAGALHTLDVDDGALLTSTGLGEGLAVSSLAATGGQLVLGLSAYDRVDEARLQEAILGDPTTNFTRRPGPQQVFVRAVVEAGAVLPDAVLSLATSEDLLPTGAVIDTNAGTVTLAVDGELLSFAPDEYNRFLLSSFGPHVAQSGEVMVNVFSLVPLFVEAHRAGSPETAGAMFLDCARDSQRCSMVALLDRQGRLRFASHGRGLTTTPLPSASAGSLDVLAVELVGQTADAYEYSLFRRTITIP